MNFEKTEVWGFEHAIRGCRNPLESWDKSDSYKRDELHGLSEKSGCERICTQCQYKKTCHIGEIIIGQNDMKLMQNLIKAGSDERKFMRQIMVSVDITAPSYFFAELDTYKIGTTRNSTSFQHKGVSKPFSINDFEIDDQRILEVFNTVKIKRSHPLIYPYETAEYKKFEVGNRTYHVYKNGRIFAQPFSYTDTLGRTRSFEEKEIILTQYPDTGYFYCNLGGRIYHERWLVHRIIAESWIPKNNDIKLEVNHKDGNKGNNSIENLEWITHSENEQHKHDNGLDGYTLRTQYLKFKNGLKLSPVEKLKIKNEYKNGMSQTYIAEKYNLRLQRVWDILNDYFQCDNYELFEHCWYLEKIIEMLNGLRSQYLETHDYSYFRLIRQLLPMGYLYKSTITMNYEVLRNMYFARRNHKLTEWHTFCNWIESLPYAKELIMYEGGDK